VGGTEPVSGSSFFVNQEFREIPFDVISAWVCTKVVQQEAIADRVKLIETFIQIAQESRVLHNFNATQEILSGLSKAPVHRMKKTWSQVDPKLLLVYENLNQLVSTHGSYANLRTALHGESPPSIPYLGTTEVIQSLLSSLTLTIIVCFCRNVSYRSHFY